MSDLFWMVSIVNRSQSKRFKEFYKKCGVSIVLETVGAGTAVSEMLDYFGLEASEKLLMFSVVTGEKWTEVKKGLQNKLKIDIPGTGIAFIVPMSSIGGKNALLFLTEGQKFQKGEETILKNTENELLVVILNQGYSDLVMDAARSAKASGGTVVHAKGTGMQHAEKFMGVSLVAEKEMIFLVAKRKDKNQIMRAIMEQAGTNSKARSIVFSLPVTSTAGMRLIEESE